MARRGMTPEELESILKERERQINYAVEREARHVAWRKNNDARIIELLDEYLQGAAREIMNETARWLINYADYAEITQAEALQRASTADIEGLAAKAKEYVFRRWSLGDQVTPFSEAANKQMRLYNFSMKMNRHQVLLGHINLALEHYGIQSDQALKGFLQGMTEAELMRQAGLLGLNLPSAEELKEYADIISGASFHGETFSDRIWNYQDELNKALGSGIRKTLLQGKAPSEWLKTLSGFVRPDFENAQYAMRRLAVTESARVQIEAQRRSYEAGNFDEYVVICEPGACPICREFYMKPQKVAEMQQGVNAPVFHPNCRCSTAPRYSESKMRSNIAAYQYYLKKSKE